jgi:NADH-quinone oxidoreductase subunit N
VFVDTETIRLLWPEIILIFMASWIYLAGAFQPQPVWWTWFSLAVYGIVAYVLLVAEASMWTDPSLAGVSGPLRIDYMGYVLRCFAVLVGVLFTLIGARGSKQNLTSEFLATVMLLVVGLMLVARANDLVLLFVSLELISIPTYVLLYLGRRDRANSEATIKYFFLSILSSALFLYGLSFLYGIAGTTTLCGVVDQASLQSVTFDFNAESMDANGDGKVAKSEVPQQMQQRWARLDTNNDGFIDKKELEESVSVAIAPIALVLLMAGLGFKIAAVPFHFYAPDVYQGCSNSNAGLLAVAPKIAGIVAILRLLVVAMPSIAGIGWQLAIVLALLTMTVGNVCALWQTNIRRLMAYSSIAHAGYMLIGVAVAFAFHDGTTSASGGTSGTLFYLLVYVCASLGTFATLVVLGSSEHEVSGVDELSGLARQRPFIAAMMAVFMFSLAGIPPLAGFWGKLSLFSSAVNTATAASDNDSFAWWFTVLAVGGALNAAIAAAYYLRIVARMYFRPAQSDLPARGGIGARTAMVLCVGMVVGLGLFPRLAIRVTHFAEAAVAPSVAVQRQSPAIIPSPRLAHEQPARD